MQASTKLEVETMSQNTKSAITCRFFTEESFQDALTFFSNDNSIVMLTENAAGEQYLLAAGSAKALMDEWNGDCDGLPENDAPVHRLWVSGEEQEISGQAFEEVLHRLAQ